MISAIVSRLVILVFGTLYPAYASYKAVRTKNVKEYVKWMMYWIVFALFTCAETVTDVFLSFWFPFYYEIKIILVLWLLSPATKGSSILYRKFVHPMLSRREQEIDEYIAKAKEQGYHTVLHLGTKGVNYATTVLMQTAIKGGGGLVNQLRRSYSLSDLSSDKESDMNRNNKALKNVPDEDELEEEADGLDPRMLRPRGYSPRRSASGSGRVEMYFPEVDVDVRQHGSSRPREPSIPLSHIRSSEDVSSGYSSAEPLYAGHHATKSEGLATSREPLVRTASVGSTRSMRTKSSRGGVVAKRGPAAEDSELQGDEAGFYYQEEYCYDRASSLPSQNYESIPFQRSVVKRSNQPPFTHPETSLPVTENKSEYVSSQSDGVSLHLDVANLKVASVEEDDDMPLYDAEAGTNDAQQSEALVKQDVTSASDVESLTSRDPVVPKQDTEMSNAGSPSSEGMFVDNSCSTSHEPDMLPSSGDDVEACTGNKEQVVQNGIEEQTLSNQQPVNDESKTFINDSAGISKDSAVTDSPNTVDSSTLPQPAEVASEIISPYSNSIKNEVPKMMESSSSADQTHTASTFQSNGQTNEDISIVESSLTDEPTEAAVAASPLTVTLAESLPQDNSMDISSDSQDLKHFGGEHLNDNVLDTLDSVPLHEVHNEQVVTNVDCTLQTKNSKDSCVIPCSTDEPGKILQEEGAVGKPLGEGSNSPHTSVESLSVPEPLSRSESQSSLKKEGRSGKYHKRPAPTPPPRNTETENVELGDKTDEQPTKLDERPPSSASTSVEKDESADDIASGSEDESAVTARLVLKPGVVRNLGPDSSTKTEVFLSKSPNAKSKKSKSKSKQGDSSLSRLLAIPKNQFGGLSSLIPFWHGKPEASNSPPAHGRTSENMQSTDNKSLEDKTEVRQLSHSPGQQRRAPLADYCKSGY